jgi:hypothetical protein
VSANTHISQAAWDAALNAALALLNGGTMNIYSGSQPATPDAALSGNTLLATLTFSATAFANASAGVATANAIASGTGLAVGTATFARCLSSGSTPELDASVGSPSGYDINLNDAAITVGSTVSVTSYTVSMPAGQ